MTLRFALLALCWTTTAFADPDAPVAQKRPSAIDVEAHLVHARDVLTKQATAMCACKTAACGSKVIRRLGRDDPGADRVHP